MENLIQKTNNLVQQCDQWTQSIVLGEIPAPQGLVQLLQQNIENLQQAVEASEELLKEAQNAVEAENFEAAVELAQNAQKLIMAVGKQFQSQYNEFVNMVDKWEQEQYQQAA